MFDVVARDLMEFPATSIVSNETATVVISEIYSQSNAIFRPDCPFCSNRCDQFTVQVSVVLLNHDSREISHLHAPKGRQGRPLVAG